MFEHNAESAKNVPIAELKRKRGSADVNTILNDVLVPMRAGFETFQNESIETWNAKIQLGNGVQMQKKFKVLNQSIVSQIKTVLADRPRLIKRTQLMRSAYNIIGKEKIADANPTDANDQVDSYDTEIFDDGDYYQQLLKELIESRMGDHEDPVQMALKLAQLKQLQNQKSRKTVDTKASKGRKIRYQVQEKIQNFMAAEPRGTWHDEMIQELFSTLFGMNFDTLATAPAVAKADGFTLI